MTFIINKEGRISHIFPKVEVRKHSEEVLRALEEIK
jgi:peroxiredoxin